MADQENIIPILKVQINNTDTGLQAVMLLRIGDEKCRFIYFLFCVVLISLRSIKNSAFQKREY